MAKTSIEWATHTTNWLAGCSKVSRACRHCYAETMTARLATMPHAPARYRDGVVKDRRWTGEISYDYGAMVQAFQGLRNARKPRRVFVNSMSDTFHENAPEESLADLAQEIRILDNSGAGRGMWHRIMLLTKRPERMLEWQRRYFPDGLPSWVWVGITAENQTTYDERRWALVRIKTEGVLFLSCEPLMSAIDLKLDECNHEDSTVEFDTGALLCRECGDEGEIGWVIAGGESGPNGRPSHPSWFRSLRDQCEKAGVPFLFKQWGEWAPGNAGPGGDMFDNGVERRPYAGAFRAAPKGPGVRSGFFDYSDRWNELGCNPFRQTMDRVGKHAAGRELDGRTWDGVPS